MKQTKKMPDHFMVDSRGDLYDTRKPNWAKLPPLREAYQLHRQTLQNIKEVKAVLRAGAYTHIGLYTLYFIAADGQPLSFQAVRDNFKEVLSAMKKTGDREWSIIGMDVNYEDNDLFCSHTNKQIKPSY